ncbi:two-component system, sporulation sensor kinase B [Mesobacillus persicus]|uniref:histidine kinase n=1 Tax=Mesobacillus persicus TaxID=930146 RepID=A0A1H8F2H4_9BACI|nr:HAMP domain-containing sensor histidine kinase [Mesobacillus persicus]SEN25830.1 two-component system, sporulation sensor kinase B [Mesobacillus persicus]
MEFTKNLLLNFSILLVLLFFMQMIKERQLKKEMIRWTTFLFYSLSIISCILLSTQVADGVQFDLRQVPFIIGSLYSGLAFPLLLVVILVRGIIGVNYGFWVTLFVFIIVACLFILVRNWFLKLTANQRVGVTMLFSTMTSLLLMIFSLLKQEPIHITEVWTSFLIVPALATGIISYTIELIRQNTLMRKQLVKAEKIEAVSHMSAAISHEIRNPLTSVKGFLQLLGEKDYPEERKREFIQIAVDELNRAEQVISDYLTFARPALDRSEEIDIQKELNHVLNVLMPLANMNAVEISQSYGREISVIGDRQKFHQAFINIIKNGLEAMPNGGGMSVEAMVSAGNVHIIIKDTGIGMTEEQLNRLGEPYYSTKGKKGTGLGLMVTYSIIEAMKGKVKVSSRLGKGSLFHITFTPSSSLK